MVESQAIKAFISMPNLPPQPSILLESLRNMGYTLKSAIADIVDNSISAASTQIAIQFRGNMDIGDPWIAICDNGEGMDRVTLLNSMKFGSRNLEDKRGGAMDLGRFGLGMKTASISQCRKLTVFSWKGESVSAFCWDLDRITTSWDIQEISQEDISKHKIINEIVDSLDFSIKKHGTIVLWEVLDRDAIKSHRNMNESMAEVENHIAEVFHRFMQKEKKFNNIITFTFNGRKVIPLSPFGPCVSERYILRGDNFKCDGHVVSYKPYILPRAVDYENASDYTRYGGKEGYLYNQGFYVYRNRRLIEKATWFRKRKKEFKTQLLRIQLDIPAELDASWCIDVRKSQTTPPLDIQNRVDSIVEAAMLEARNHWDSGTRNIRVTRDYQEPIWAIQKRQGRNAAHSYKVNKKHALYQLILGRLPGSIRPLFSEYADTISETFPYEQYYSDRNQSADYKQELEDTPVDERLTTMINALCECNLEEEDIRALLLKSETTFSPALINKYLTIKFKH